MNRIIRQAFGNSRPKDVFFNLLTFDRMVTRPVVHIIYWVGLGLLVIGAFAVAGIAAGEIMKEGLPGLLAAIAMLIAGWLAILIGVLLWRGMCEFYMAVLSIAEDLRYLRQFQEKLPVEPAHVQPAVVQPVAPQAPVPQASVPQASAPQASAPKTVEAAAPAAEAADITETPFFQPRFGKRPD